VKKAAKAASAILPFRNDKDGSMFRRREKTAEETTNGCAGAGNEHGGYVHGMTFKVNSRHGSEKKAPKPAA
jgi:hypothetical protein